MVRTWDEVVYAGCDEQDGAVKWLAEHARMRRVPHIIQHTQHRQAARRTYHRLLESQDITIVAIGRCLLQQLATQHRE